MTNPWPPWRAPCAVGLFPAGWRGSSHCGALSLGEMVEAGPGRRPARPCLCGTEERGPGRKTSLLSPRPSRKSSPLPQTPSTNQPGDHPGPEPSTAATASWPSSSGQVSPYTSRLELVLEGPQGPAGHQRTSEGPSTCSEKTIRAGRGTRPRGRPCFPSATIT